MRFPFSNIHHHFHSLLFILFQCTRTSKFISIPSPFSHTHSFTVSYTDSREGKEMRVLAESWCFCNGGGKSERMKAGIFSGKSPSMARIGGGGTGFLIHRNLLLTTHANLPSVAAAEAAEICLHNGFSGTLFPHRLVYWTLFCNVVDLCQFCVC